MAMAMGQLLSGKADAVNNHVSITAIAISKRNRRGPIKASFLAK